MRGGTTANEPLLASPSDLNHHQPEEGKESDGGNLLSRTWSESKKIWLIAGPSIFCRLAMFSLTVITQAFAGHLGDRDLAAISIATTVIISISFGFLLGMASALETLCGQAYGAKQYHMLGVYMQRFLQCQLKTAVVAWVSGGALALHHYYVRLGVDDSAWIFCSNRGIWAGMISGTVVQTFILSIFTIRCKWDKEDLASKDSKILMLLTCILVTTV
ncbi:hypothetical protein RJ640_023457 [Escallonia rubra]|uniref:Uncharacterized protein n=1 Tax=Escallonia rubra TaxID=112253 RepID=A0AA88RLF4_9ASTE|nr:hypothetical protein RJ640_023457 [Escallonia rubra]